MKLNEIQSKEDTFADVLAGRYFDGILQIMINNRTAEGAILRKIPSMVEYGPVLDRTFEKAGYSLKIDRKSIPHEPVYRVEKDNIVIGYMYINGRYYPEYAVLYFIEPDKKTEHVAKIYSDFILYNGKHYKLK